MRKKKVGRKVSLMREWTWTDFEDLTLDYYAKIFVAVNCRVSKKGHD